MAMAGPSSSLPLPLPLRAESPLSDIPSDVPMSGPPAAAAGLSQLALRRAGNPDDSDTAGSISALNVSTAIPVPPSSMLSAPPATAPMTRGRVSRREKTIKFSPAKGRSQTTQRRAAAAVAAGNLANATTGGRAAAAAAAIAEDVPNNDFCEACGGKGHFLCCDGCPRSFHFSCLNPPLELDTIPADSWYCRVCDAARKPPPLNKGLFGQLINNVVAENPTTFVLPKDIKNSFKNISTGTYGEFVDTNEFRPLSGLGKSGKGGYEERDPFKLKDKTGRSVFCHRCHEPASAQRQRRILSCDFCELHWHLDCVDPPLVALPAVTRRWKCPIHADTAMAPDKKLKHQRLIRVKDPYTKNNGDIEIIPQNDKTATAVHKPEEHIVQGLRYQVPEQIIILDFWSKVRRNKFGQPLTGRKRAASPSSVTSFDFSDSSSLTSMEASPERDMGPGRRAPPDTANGLSAPGSSLLDRIASTSQQSIPQSAREDTEVSDGDPPDIAGWNVDHNPPKPNGIPLPSTSQPSTQISTSSAPSASPSKEAFPSSGPGTPQLSQSFQQLLSAAGLGPANRARSISPAHPATSTPARARRLSNLTSPLSQGAARLHSSPPAGSPSQVTLVLPPGDVSMS